MKRSIDDIINDYNRNLDKLHDNINKLSKKERDGQIDTYLKKIDRCDFYAPNDYSNTNFNPISNNKNCNNVRYTGSYSSSSSSSSSLSRSSSNCGNGISYGPSIF